MPKYTSKPIEEGLDTASTQFRELAAECVELAQKSHSPERRMEYVKMANAWHKMAIRWEKDFHRTAPRGWLLQRIAAFRNNSGSFATLAATLQRKIDHTTATITRTVTTYKTEVSGMVLTWPKWRAAAPTNAKATVAANFQRGLKLRLRRLAVAYVTPSLQPPSRATSARPTKHRHLRRAGPTFRPAPFLL
jgi:hypothetical protein